MDAVKLWETTIEVHILATKPHCSKAFLTNKTKQNKIFFTNRFLSPDHEIRIFRSMFILEVMSPQFFCVHETSYSQAIAKTMKGFVIRQASK